MKLYRVIFPVAGRETRPQATEPVGRYFDKRASNEKQQIK